MMIHSDLSNFATIMLSGHSLYTSHYIVMKKILRYVAAAVLAACSVQSAGASVVTVDMSRHGVKPGASDLPRRIARVLESLPKRSEKDTVVLKFAPGRYDFRPDNAPKRELFISNHDQDNPKTLGMVLDGKSNIIVDGNYADFVFHGRMLPIAAIGCRNITLRNFSIDFENPHIAQIRILSSDDKGITFRPEKWVKWRRDSKGGFETFGDGWSLSPRGGIAFERDTRHIVYNTSDLSVPLDSIVDTPGGALRAPRWVDKRLKPGMIVALRGWQRPTPGIFLTECVDTRLECVKVHYAEGMGLLAQLCSGVTLDEFNVSLRGEDDPRYFTTQADATHFSGCEGLIYSRGGLYEGMMDDAINVHGTYLRVTSSDGRTLTGRYMHGQSYGFKWGEPGDSVQIVLSNTMERFGAVNVIESIKPLDASTAHGAKEFMITLREPIDLPDSCLAGIENLRWTPSVVFADNVVQNNRARGALFSTPRHVECVDNVFDHTSGSAVLLCGDCNGWFETGACRDVVISRNHFINSLTSMFQFTEAVISIYPEIPDLAGQKEYFHGGKDVPGIAVTDNVFVTFDAPLVYAKSVDGLNISGNSVTPTSDYPALHPNRYNFKLEHVRNAVIERNQMPFEVSVLVK